MSVANRALLKLAEAKCALEEWSEFVANTSPPDSIAEQALWNLVTTAISHVDDDEEAILLAYGDLVVSQP